MGNSRDWEKAFFSQGDADLKAAENLISNSDFVAQRLWFLQQAVEKFLKSYVLKLNNTSPGKLMKHSLDSILKPIPREKYRKLAKELSKKKVGLNEVKKLFDPLLPEKDITKSNVRYPFEDKGSITYPSNYYKQIRTDVFTYAKAAKAVKIVVEQFAL
jgi:HEPN domain-containing protein